jgi:hypothetical protein
MHKVMAPLWYALLKYTCGKQATIKEVPKMLQHEKELPAVLPIKHSQWRGW